MKACCGFGHRLVFDNIKEALSVEVLKAAKTGFELFYTGAMGEFDSLFSYSVYDLKQKYPNIKLLCIQPYLKNEINKNKDFYSANYDDIIIPSEVDGMHYKAAITVRNRWMIDNSDLIISYTKRNYGGAANAIRYANKRNKQIINLADAQ